MSDDLPTAIEEIEIINFRGIERLKLDFRQPSGEPARMVVLAGPNGSGKTTVLEACLLALDRQTELTGHSGRRAIRHGVEYFQLNARVRWQVHRDRTMSGTATSTSHREGVENSWTFAQDGSPIQWLQIDPPDASKVEYFSSQRRPSLIGALGVSVGKRPEATEANRLQTIKQALVDRLAHARLRSTRSSVDEPSPDAVFEAINRQWNRFYTDQSFQVGAVSDAAEDGFDVFLHSGDDRRSVDLLSSGQLELFMLISSLCIAPKTSGIVIIDEPELHLDPQWHRLLLRMLTDLAPRCQFIMGTHSPEIYDAVMSFERHFLAPADDPRTKYWLAAANGARGQ